MVLIQLVERCHCRTMKAKHKNHKEQLSIRTLSPSAWAFPVVSILIVVVASLFVLIPQAQQLMDDRKEVEKREVVLEKMIEKRPCHDA